MRTVVLVPRREDNGRRDEIWNWVNCWMLEFHPDYHPYEGTDDGEVFSLSKARNDAAQKAGDWDVAIILDSDTIAEPDVLNAAVQRASRSMNLVIAGDVRLCMDKQSTDNTLKTDVPWFPRPDGRLAKTGTGASDSIYAEPSSGVMAISRRLWDAMGGYLECMQGYGYEDLVFLTMSGIYGEGVMWMPGTMLHLWHERSRMTADTQRNFELWQDLDQIARHANSQEVAREYLAKLGHTVP